jgi:hypothetical protein
MSVAAIFPDVNRDLNSAHHLVEHGVPVFAARLTDDGQPDKLDRRWRSWQEKQPSIKAIDSWQPGEALCAVTGIAFDVIDWDPRNDPGGQSFNKLSSALGDDGPEVFWQVSTPRGGRHMYVAALGLGSHNGFLPGIDLKGGHADGTGRGFVFIPPTSRLGGSYYLTSASRISDEPCEPLKNYIQECLDLPKATGNGAAREHPDDLKRAVVIAGAGEQRTALLRYVHELERKGYSRDDIVVLLRALLPEVKNFNGRDPWYPARGGNPDLHIQGLFHRKGTIIPDAAPGEVDGIAKPQRKSASLIKRFSDVDRQRTQWLWRGRLARGEMTITDGEKGVAKSLVAIDVASRGSKGMPMPGESEDESTGEILTTIIFTAESSISKEIAPRIDAAGGDSYYIVTQEDGLVSVRGRVKKEWILPDGADMFDQAIREADADIAIFDPINDFLGEDINTNNDASIRRALKPLGRVLQQTGCAGWMIRHMNKDTGANARMRGSGTTAYQNRARVHMVAGRLPEGSLPGSGARYGIAIVDSNLRRLEKGVLAYNAVDSDIVADDADGMVPKVEWHGWCNVEADDLVRDAVNKPKGPEPMVQLEIREVLEEMFEEKDTWPKTAVLERLRESGIKANPKTIDKVKASMGIRHERVARRGAAGGIQHYNWTIKTVKGKVQANVDDEE